MWSAITGFASTNALKIAGLLLTVLSLVLMLFGAKRSGRAAEKVDHMSRQLKGLKDAKKIRREIADDHRDGVVPKRVSKFYID